MLDAEVVIFFDFRITLLDSFILDERDSSFLKAETVGAEIAEGYPKGSMRAKISEIYGHFARGVQISAEIDAGDPGHIRA